MRTRNEILEEINKLQPSERKQLADEILKSLDEGQMEKFELSDAQMSELLKRQATFKKDPAKMISWQVVEQDLLKRKVR